MPDWMHMYWTFFNYLLNFASSKERNSWKKIGIPSWLHTTLTCWFLLLLINFIYTITPILITRNTTNSINAPIYAYDGFPFRGIDELRKLWELVNIRWSCLNVNGSGSLIQKPSAVEVHPSTHSEQSGPPCPIYHRKIFSNNDIYINSKIICLVKHFGFFWSSLDQSNIGLFIYHMSVYKQAMQNIFTAGHHLWDRK